MMASYELEHFIVNTNSGLTTDKLYFFMYFCIKTRKSHLHFLVILKKWLLST